MKFIITGIGRSATKFASQIFTKAGIPVTWETAFQVNSRDVNAKLNDASWLAAPFISELPEGTQVLHQTRNPLMWLRSWSYNTVRWPRRHIQFVNDHSKLLYWDRMPRPQVDMRVWVAWNQMIEHQVRVASLPYFQYRVEDLDTTNLLKIAEMLEIQVDPIVVEQAFLDVTKDVNATPKDTGKILKWSDLPLGPELDAFKDLASKYGYEVTDE